MTVSRASQSIPMDYDLNVFINCPFDPQYLPLFHTLVYVVTDCGFIAQCAQEDDGSEVRVQKILRIIRECRVGIHDISRTEVSPDSGLPRFNMPLELGMFLGAKAYGTGRQSEKKCLVLDKEPHRYQRYISDIGGQDIHAHADNDETVVQIVRDFLGGLQPGVIIPGSGMIHKRYVAFTNELPVLCGQFGIDPARVNFKDYRTFAQAWLAERKRLNDPPDRSRRATPTTPSPS